MKTIVPIGQEELGNYIRDLLGEQDEDKQARGVISALKDTDFKDQDAFFKMAQLIKGLAASAKESALAKKFLAQLSDDVTATANKVLGKKESLDEVLSRVEKQAFDLGVAAFKAGKRAIPVQDAKFMALLKSNAGQIGKSIPLLEAWARGWTQSNLAKK